MGSSTVALHSNAAYCNLKPAKFSVVTLATGTSVPAAAASTHFTRATFYAYKAWANDAVPTNNSNAVWIGLNDRLGGSGVTAGSAPFLQQIPAGMWAVIDAPPGAKYDLADVSLLGSTGDKILVAYEQ